MAAENMTPDNFMDEEEKAEAVPKVGEDEKLTDDGGVVKRIIALGAGWDSPEKGDEVTVHYTGTLTDGTKFDSSVDRGDPFKFTLGQGSVIKSWDIGVAAMKKGERALLIAAPEYAYGAAGSPPKIPANSTLHFEVELLSWKSVKDLSGDGGIVKTIKAEGTGWEKPSGRDVVTVEYQVRVAGSEAVVAAAPEGGAQFAADGSGPLRAFATALPTMQKGESVHLAVRSDYGFREGERPEGVAADANLEVTLELVSWQKVENVTDDGAIMKKTVVASSDWKKPSVGATVTVHLTGRLPDGTVFDDRDLKFVTDEEQVVEGVELAVHKMKKGETAEVALPPRYAYGDAEAMAPGGTVPVPAASTVTYTIQLLDLENPKQSYEMSDAEKVEAGVVAKEKGNARFKAGKWVAALVKYKAAIDMTKDDKDFKTEDRAVAREVTRAAHLNSAACHLKMGQPRDALTSATKVLAREGGNVKALWRAAQAHLQLGDFPEAETAIRRGLAEDPSNASLRALLKEHKQRSAASNKRDKAMFGKMFRPSKQPLYADAPASTPAAAKKASAAAAEPAAHPIELAPSGDLPGGVPASDAATDGSAGAAEGVSGNTAVPMEAA